MKSIKKMTDNQLQKHYENVNKGRWEDSRTDKSKMAVNYTIDADKRRNYKDEPKLTK